MSNSEIPEQLRRFEIPGRITLLEGNGELPKVEAHTDWSTAEIYLHGAHITDFQKNGEPPLIFTSQFSRFNANQPIRGGIPIVFPWFGPREDEPMHGFARLADWELHEATTVPDGGVSLRFRLPEVADCATWPPFSANYVVTITDTLTMELIVTNTSSEHEFTFENCLHTYFAVGDIGAVGIKGLKGATYLDKSDHFASKIDDSEILSIAGEIDRVYEDSTGPVEIHDSQLRRKIRVEKTGSASTVVWNPWNTRSQHIADFGNEEYKQMVCVESGNIGKNQITLAPGKSAVLRVVISSQPL